MELNLEELLNSLTVEDLNKILKNNGISTTGNKVVKVENIINLYNNNNSSFIDLINTFDNFIINKIIENLKIVYTKDMNTFTKRKLIYNFFNDIKANSNNDNLELIANNIVNLFKAENSRLEKSTTLTYSTKLSHKIYKIETLISDLKHNYKINRYLDPRFHSNSVNESIIYSEKKDLPLNNYIKNYEISLLYYFYDLSKNNEYNRKSYIDNLTRFFLKVDIRERLNYKDIKKHKTGGTRCLNYARGSLKKLEKLLMIETSEKSLSLTLFGILIISNIIYKTKNKISYSYLLGVELPFMFYLENLREIKHNINKIFDFLDDEVFVGIRKYIDIYLDILYKYSKTDIFNENNISSEFEEDILKEFKDLKKQLKSDSHYQELSNLIVKQLKLNQLEFKNSNEEK